MNGFSKEVFEKRLARFVLYCSAFFTIPVTTLKWTYDLITFSGVDTTQNIAYKYLFTLISCIIIHILARQFIYRYSLTIKKYQDISTKHPKTLKLTDATLWLTAKWKNELYSLGLTLTIGVTLYYAIPLLTYKIIESSMSF